LLVPVGLGLLFHGCAPMTPAATLPPVVPTVPSPTPPPFHYLHYTPNEELNVHLEFDYPDYWYFSEERMQYTGYVIVYLADPGILAVPTRDPDDPHGSPSDIPHVSIWIEPREPGETLEALWQEQKHIDETSNMVTLLADYPLQIDGHDAYALETRNDIPELYGGSMMFNRRIFFLAYDQVYTLDFLIAEQYRGDRFEQGYKHFFASLEIVP
jgi:hypothetical protein